MGHDDHRKVAQQMTDLAVRGVVVVLVMHAVLMVMDVILRRHARIGMRQSAVAHNCLPSETRRQKGSKQHDEQ